MIVRNFVDTQHDILYGQEFSHTDQMTIKFKIEEI
jgi:hypothetical protein